MKNKIKIGQILNNEDVVNLVGNEKQIKTFYKNKKLTEPSKSAILKQLNSICKYETTKIGRKQAYKIIEIYDEKKEIIDKRKINNRGNNSIFVEDFKVLIINLLHNDATEEKIISKTGLFHVANLINDNYKIGRKDKNKLSELLETPKKTIDDFYDNTHSKMKKTIESCLKNCRSSSILTYESVIALAIYEPQVSKNKLDKAIVVDGSYIKNNIVTVYREATKEEKQFILKCENKVKEDLGLDKNANNNEIYLRGLWKTYKQKVKEELKNTESNIKYYYEAYKLTWNKENIEELYYKYCTVDNIIMSKDLINKNIVKSINKTNKTRENKMINGKEKLLENFIEDNEKLINVLIDYKAKNIKEDLKNMK